MRKRSMAVAGLGVAVALAGCGGGQTTSSARDVNAEPDTQLVAQPVASKSDPRTISVQATGRVKGKPDTMTITIGVQSRGNTAQEALGQNSDRAQRVIDSLKREGVSADDIQTSEISVSPVFDDEGRRITGYAVSNMVTAKLRKIDAAGKVIDAAAKQAGDDIRLGGVQFSIEDTGKLVEIARGDAVKQARAQAEQYAKAAGVGVGEVQTINESYSPPTPALEVSRLAADEASGAAPPVEAGTQELSVQISVVYAIK